MVFLIRREGKLEIETDHHVCGIFNKNIWNHLLQDLGFEVHQMELKLSSEEKCYPMFVCIKRE